MLDQRGREEPCINHALGGTIAGRTDVIGHADMQMARAIIGGRERGATRCVRFMPMVVPQGNAVVLVPIVRAMRMRVVVMDDALAAAAVDRDAQHPPRRHAGAHLREQEKRQEDASDQDLHEAGFT